MIGGQMDRYVGATVLRTTALVLVCLLTVMTLFTFVDELGDITASYTMGHVLLAMLYRVPQRLYELVPYGVFIGALVGLGILSNRSEITVLRGAGISPARLFGAAAAPALLLLVGNQALGEFAGPAGEAAASAVKLPPRDAAGHYRKAHWRREGGLYTSIDGYAANGDPIGIRQFAVVDGQLQFSRQARRARRLTAADGDYWLLIDVLETHFAAAATSVRRHDTLPWHSDAGPELLSAKALLDPGKLSFTDLGFQIRHLSREGLDPTPYQIVLWSKALQPLAVLGLVLLAVGFVVGPLREAGLGARLAVGIAVGLTFKYLADVFGPMSIVFAIPPYLAMAAPIALAYLAGALLLRRV